MYGERLARGELWWVQFDIAYGSEAAYRRPALIIQNDVLIQSGIHTILVIPLSSNLQLLDGMGNVLITKSASTLAKDSIAIVAQVYALDRSRFIEKISSLKPPLMKKIETGLKLVQGIQP
jgi:mRNA interferase MazF